MIESSLIHSSQEKPPRVGQRPKVTPGTTVGVRLRVINLPFNSIEKKN